MGSVRWRETTEHKKPRLARLLTLSFPWPQQSAPRAAAATQLLQELPHGLPAGPGDLGLEQGQGERWSGAALPARGPEPLPAGRRASSTALEAHTWAESRGIRGCPTDALTCRYGVFEQLLTLPVPRNQISRENARPWLLWKNSGRPAPPRGDSAEASRCPPQTRSSRLATVPGMPHCLASTPSAHLPGSPAPTGSEPRRPAHAHRGPSSPSPSCPPRPPTLHHGHGHPLTLLLSRRHGAPAFASGAVAGLLGGVVLRLQVLWRRGGRGSRVLPGGLMDFGDLPREARGNESAGRRDRGKPSRPPQVTSPKAKAARCSKARSSGAGG